MAAHADNKMMLHDITSNLAISNLEIQETITWSKNRLQRWFPR